MIAYIKTLLTAYGLLPKDQKGQDAAEYALLIALIAIVIIIAVTALGARLVATFQGVTDALPGP